MAEGAASTHLEAADIPLPADDAELAESCLLSDAMIANSAVAGYHSRMLLLALMQAADAQSHFNTTKGNVRLNRERAAQPKAGQQ